MVALFFFAAIGSASAQGWRGIVPLKSKCADVQRILGIAACRNATYDLADARITIGFSDGTCATGWKVESDTVLFIAVTPKTPRKLAEYALDESRYKKTVDEHLREVTYYENEEGESIAVFSDGTVTLLSYEPSKIHSHLRCPSEHKVRPPRNSLKFDEFESLSQKEQEGRLDNYVFELRASPASTAYVISHTQQGRQPEAQERAKRLKDYLVSKGIARDRIVTVDGETRNSWVIELFIVIN